MRLAMIGHKDFPSRSGGVEVVVWELATRLARRDCRVAVYNRGRRRGDNHGWAEGVEYFRAPTMGTGGVSAMLCSLTATVQALLHGYDLIHYHALGPSVMLALARLGGVGTVATVHGLDWRRAKWNAFASAYLRLGERVIAKYADEVIVLSRDMQTYFREVYGRETHLIENGVAPVAYAPCGEIARRWGLEKGSYVLFLARIVPEKGLHYLIRAFRRCKTDRQLVIAGEGPDSPVHRPGDPGAGPGVPPDPVHRLRGGTDAAGAVQQLRFVRAAQRGGGPGPEPAGGHVGGGPVPDQRHPGERGCAGGLWRHLCQRGRAVPV